MRKNLTFDERELKEIHHALYYREVLAHGTVGHNQLMLLGKIADALGFYLDQTGVLMFHADPTPRDLFFPDGTLEQKNANS